MSTHMDTPRCECDSCNPHTRIGKIAWDPPELVNSETQIFQKHDAGKRRYELLQYDALEEIVKALEYGAEKYDDYNYLKGAEWSRYFAAGMRHLTAWWMGESRDPESGLTHLAHAGACILFLITYEKRSLGTDNRPTALGWFTHLHTRKAQPVTPKGE